MKRIDSLVTSFVPLALGLVAGLAVWSALVPWDTLVSAPQHSSPVLTCVLLVALTAGLVRLLGVSGWIALPVAALVGFSVPLHAAGAGPLPSPGAVRTLATALGEDLDSIRQYSVPIPDEGGSLLVLITLLTLVLAVLIDLVVVSRSWILVGGFLLLPLHLVPGYFGDPPRWQSFLLTGALFVTLLALQQLRQSNRGSLPTPPAAGVRPESRWRALATGTAIAGSTGGVALALAVLVTPLVPLPGAPWWDSEGPGGSSDEVTISNPLIDLRRDLTRGADVDLLTVRGSGPAPSYLKTAVLTEYDGTQWRTGERRASEADRAAGTLSPLPGIAAELEVATRAWDFSATPQFRSRWLPLPEQVSSVRAPGDWRYDSSTRDFVAWEPDLDTAGLRWEAVEARPQVTSEQLESAPQGNPDEGLRWTQVPNNLPPLVSELAREVTDGADSSFAKATALQNWFRSEFTYSLDRVESIGDDDLVAFLLPDGRVGYCEQFSASMALMARTLDIPARVAVGFLSPEKRGKETYVFSAHDLHAWPELYFEGAGWVRFEPTPGDRAQTIPEYTAEESAPAPSPSASPSASATPSNRPTPTPSTAPQPTPETPAARAEPGPWKEIVAGVAGTALLLALLLTPRQLRRRRRRARLAAGDPESRWQELLDSARDLGVTPPAGISPRQAADHLGASPLHLDPVLLTAWTTAVEESRYAAREVANTAPADPAGIASATSALEGMGRDLTRWQRLRGTWLPASLFAR